MLKDLLSLLKSKFKKQPKAPVKVTIKNSKLDFIGKTTTVDIIRMEDVDDHIIQSTNALTVYINEQDEQLKQELNQTITDSIDDAKAEIDQKMSDLKDYSDAQDQQVENQTDIKLANTAKAINAEITKVSAKADNAVQDAQTANQNATNALNKANDADQKATNALNEVNNINQKIDGFQPFLFNDCVLFTVKDQFNNQYFSSFKLMTTTNVHIHASLQVFNFTIPSAFKDQLYKYYRGKDPDKRKPLFYEVQPIVVSCNLQKGNKYTCANSGIASGSKIQIFDQPNNVGDSIVEIFKTMWMYDQNWGQGNQQTEVEWTIALRYLGPVY